MDEKTKAKAQAKVKPKIEKKYLILTMGRKEVMGGPGQGGGKNELSPVMIPDPEFPDGYKPITGDWQPVSLQMQLFESREEFDAFVASPAYENMKNAVEIAIAVQLGDPSEIQEGSFKVRFA